MTSRIFRRVLMAAIAASGTAVATATVPNGALGPDFAEIGTGTISIDDSRVIAASEVRGNPLWAIPLKDLSATRERPIFAPSRQPPPPAVAANSIAPPAITVKAPEPERPQLTLVGTVVGDGEGYGIFLDRTTSAVLRIKTGQSHNGWLLVEVRGRDALLQRGQKTAMLSLPVRPTEAPADHNEDERNSTRRRMR